MAVEAAVRRNTPNPKSRRRTTEKVAEEDLDGTEDDEPTAHGGEGSGSGSGQGVEDDQAGFTLLSKRLRDRTSRRSDLQGSKRARAAASVRSYVRRHYADLGIPWMVPPPEELSPPSPPRKAEGDQDGAGRALLADSDSGARPSKRVGDAAVGAEVTIGLSRSGAEDGRKEDGVAAMVERKEGTGEQPVRDPMRAPSLAQIMVGRMVVGHVEAGLVGSGSGGGGDSGGGGFSAHNGVHRHVYLHEHRNHHLQQQQQQQHQGNQQHQDQGQQLGSYSTWTQLPPSTQGYPFSPQPYGTGLSSITNNGSPFSPSTSAQHFPAFPAAGGQQAGTLVNEGATGDRGHPPASAGVAEIATDGSRSPRAQAASTIVVAATMAWTSHEKTPGPQAGSTQS